MGQRSGPPANERRVDPRFPIRVPVEYQHPTVVGQGTTWDVSLSGVRVEEASFRIRVGAAVTLRFSFFQGSQDLWFPASVVRHTGEGFAVHFEGLGEVQVAVLSRALREAAD